MHRKKEKDYKNYKKLISIMHKAKIISLGIIKLYV